MIKCLKLGEFLIYSFC